MTETRKQAETPEELTALVEQIAEKRRLVQAAGAEYKQAEDEFQAKHADEFAILNQKGEILKRAMMDLNEFEMGVRAEAVMYYLQHKDAGEDLVPGLKIRLDTVYGYDPADALAWAIDKGICLNLDERAFKDLCKSDRTRPDFVTVNTRPVALISASVGVDDATETSVHGQLDPQEERGTGRREAARPHFSQKQSDKELSYRLAAKEFAKNPALVGTMLRIWLEDGNSLEDFSQEALENLLVRTLKVQHNDY